MNDVVQTSNESNGPNDRYRKVENHPWELLPCRLCGFSAELWQRWVRDDIWCSFGACSNLEDVDGEACIFHLPDSGHFYCERKSEAVRYWNLMMGPRGSNETSERHVCWACQATYAGPRAGGKCSRCASGADPVRAVAWVGFPADQPKPDYDIAYDEVSKLPGHQYTAVYWQPPAPKASERRGTPEEEADWAEFGDCPRCWRCAAPVITIPGCAPGCIRNCPPSPQNEGDPR